MLEFWWRNIHGLVEEKQNKKLDAKRSLLLFRSLLSLVDLWMRNVSKVRKEDVSSCDPVSSSVNIPIVDSLNIEERNSLYQPFPHIDGFIYLFHFDSRIFGIWSFHRREVTSTCLFNFLSILSVNKSIPPLILTSQRKYNPGSGE